MGFELAEVVAEHGDELPRLYVVGRTIAPGVARIQNARIHARHRYRHAEMEVRIDAHLDMGERAVERRRKQRPRRLDRHAFADPERTARPARVHEPAIRLMLGDEIAQEVAVFRRMARHEGRAEAGGEGGLRLVAETLFRAR